MGITCYHRFEQFKLFRDSLKSLVKLVGMTNIKEHGKNQYGCVSEFIGNMRSLEKCSHSFYLQPVPTVLAMHLAKQIAEAILYLHSLKPPLLFRHLNLANIFLTKEFLKLWEEKSVTIPKNVALVKLNSTLITDEVVGSEYSSFRKGIDAFHTEMSDIFDLGKKKRKMREVSENIHDERSEEMNI